MDLEFNVDSNKVGTITNKIKRTILNSTKDAVKKVTVKLTRIIKYDKLSGRASKTKNSKPTTQVLNKISGTLKNSIKRDIENIRGGDLKATISTNVKYAKVHEYGFKGSVNVKQHVRQINKAFGKAIQSKQIVIGSFSKSVNYPERSFMRSTLKQNTPMIYREVSKAINDGLKDMK